MWLHAGVVHLLINMLCLLVVGIRLEQEFGFVRIGLVYLISGFGGSLMSALFKSLYANKVAALLTLLLVILSNLALGLLPRVDNFAHIGGLVSGFLLGFVFFVRPHLDWQRSAGGGQGQRKHRTYQYVLWLAAAALLVAGLTAATVLLFRGYDANQHCPWCHYLSCVPTRRWRCDGSPTTCTATPQENNTLSVVCEGGSNRTYVVAAASQSQDRITDLCNQLCT